MTSGEGGGGGTWPRGAPGTGKSPGPRRLPHIWLPRTLTAALVVPEEATSRVWHLTCLPELARTLPRTDVAFQEGSWAGQATNVQDPTSPGGGAQTPPCLASPEVRLLRQTHRSGACLCPRLATLCIN